MLAGMCSAGIVSAILPGPLNVSTTLGANTSIAQGVFLEMFLTSLLVFTIFMLAAEKHKATFLAPVGIGLALFVAELVGVFYTGGSLNPARSFGPCVVTKNFPGYHYIYWFGPVMGTLLAWGMYRIVKSVEYQTVNPGQDFDDHEVSFHIQNRKSSGEAPGNNDKPGCPLQAPIEPRQRYTSRASQCRCYRRRRSCTNGFERFRRKRA
jgi:aquaporin related protein